jgi:DNA-binding response OmpR family regulator
MRADASNVDFDKALRAVRALTAGRREATGILLVEADPDVQWRLAKMLGELASRVVGTSTGEGALALMSMWPVDLVLVDQNIPGTSGIEVAERLRKAHPDTPLVLMTAAESHDLRVRARLAGAMGLLVKPFGFDHLRELLERLVEHLALSPLHGVPDPAVEPAE